ncbi:1-(5-phosphoribosyl)-5-[(5-phosphoribosylamino)methylideneamino]imidazole-4-carboxamide isomerase [Ammonifex thiophilus]|uniref:1-(5-phosphoribosyl)-5-[(5-phosphoribosylamino)methylideneamino] imidazole-4-carboxamide isomerase n=1 Tax=Ammonifex thiophilus TaxID=444093 RepID=A0A3D8P8H4_9THEO|nr:1-(5-phosphoribosyl)-5-[(5-phosphoribosylamino)methylideneamino]imidazole-4-carboxamide isomerase [Ammonifex thiophilus]RDV84835.1 1-(5-phosphoribosyl)-5-[(5-phosphoribosylamino)methylideneamino]imidazole-4-carboxamide isomerase [Ammonifex thiophilus]
MLVIPAIDLKGGRCVRLVEGKAALEVVYSSDPVEVALSFQAAGAKWLHVVDLDGAFRGEPANLDAMAAIIRAVSIPVQVGGGIRSRETAEKIFALGAARIILGTAAVREKGLLQELLNSFGKDRIAVSVDAREGRVAVKGWEEVTMVDALTFGRELRLLGVTRVIFTDIKRDGTLKGPNVAAVAEFARFNPGLRVIASGGVSRLEDLMDLKKLAPLGVEGVIVGKALYDGRIDLKEALRLMEEEGNAG